MEWPRTVWFDEAGVGMIDQTRLPCETVELRCTSVQEVWDAIKRLSVRGAPAIGVAAAYGVALAARLARQAGNDGRGVAAATREAAAYLATSRPTAVNLFWALDRMRARIDAALADGADAAALAACLEREARAIAAEDAALCEAIGRHGAALLPDRATVLTHCNAGALATAGCGTALAVLYTAARQGKHVTVYADETRPLLQGARLTAWELGRAGLSVTVICDNAAAHVMRDKGVNAVVVGADRIAANGDTANKIGTYGVALLARAHDIPFYVAAPTTTLDFSLASGEAIPIEERSPDEVGRAWGVQTVPEGTACYNPAFDVTPARLISGIITEHGVARPPYETSLRILATPGAVR